MDVTNYIKPELMIIIPILYGLGVWIKAIPKIKSYLIPFILLGISIVLSILYMVGSEQFKVNGNMIISGIFQGIIIALTTVGGNQIVKQMKEIKVNNNNNNNNKDKMEK